MNKIGTSLIMTLLLLMVVTIARAQDYSTMNLHFIYIDHEPSTPVNQLCERMRTLRDDAIEIDDALIIYLADGKQSLMSFTNLKDIYGKNRDTNDAFVSIIAALQDANSHDVIASEDRKNILNLFDEYNFVNEEGLFKFSSVTMDFYVGSEFWSLGNNEKVISHLYVDFDVAMLPKDKFFFNIFRPKGETLEYPEGKPFGNNNIDGINEKLSIFEY